MAWVRLKTRPPCYLLEEAPQFRPGDRLGAATSHADEVLVGCLVGEVIDQGSVAHVGVADQARFLEGFERAIYGRRIDRRVARRNETLVDVAGREVKAVGLGQHGADGPTRCGDPESVRPKAINQKAQCWFSHGAKLVRRRAHKYQGHLRLRSRLGGQSQGLNRQ